MARSLLLLLLALSCYTTLLTTTEAARATPSDAAACINFIKTSCVATEYPALCVNTLSPYAATVGDSPMQLAWAALAVSLGGARNASAALKEMTVAGGGLAPAAASAARDCMDMLGDAVNMLRQSVATMAGIEQARDVRFQIGNVQTWASAALTDDDMCMQGFAGEAAGVGGARAAVRGHVVHVAHLTANALGIVNGLSKQSP